MIMEYVITAMDSFFEKNITNITYSAFEVRKLIVDCYKKIDAEIELEFKKENANYNHLQYKKNLLSHIYNQLNESIAKKQVITYEEFWKTFKNIKSKTIYSFAMFSLKSLPFCTFDLLTSLEGNRDVISQQEAVLITSKAFKRSIKLFKYTNDAYEQENFLSDIKDAMIEEFSERTKPFTMSSFMDYIQSAMDEALIVYEYECLEYNPLVAVFTSELNESRSIAVASALNESASIFEILTIVNEINRICLFRIETLEPEYQKYCLDQLKLFIESIKKIIQKFSKEIISKEDFYAIYDETVESIIYPSLR